MPASTRARARSITSPSWACYANEVTVADTVSTQSDAHTGVPASCGDGSIFLEGISKSQMAQGDFMFNTVEGDAFVPDPQISNEGERADLPRHACWMADGLG